MTEYSDTTGILTMYCDEPGCEVEQDFSGDNWKEAMAEATGDGWRNMRGGGAWLNLCENH